jgi:hypothetical protein
MTGLILSLILRPTVSRTVCLGMKHTSGAYDQISDYCQPVAGLLMWGALSDERTGLSFTIVAGPRQRSHFRARDPWDSWPYFTVSDSRLPLSSPPTTLRATMEVSQFSVESSRVFCYDRCSVGLSVLEQSTLLGLTARSLVLWTNCQKKSQSYVTTDGQQASLSWNKAPIWGLRPDLDYFLTFEGVLIWGALSHERTGLSFAIATGPR